MKRLRELLLGLAGLFGAGGAQVAGASPDTPETIAARARMVVEIAAMARDTAAETMRPVFGARVMAAMGRVPRHLFVPPAARAFAYDNRPLAIGHGQTISQPYIVALMTDLVEPSAGDVVLEVGAGSGYQAAVLAELVRHVYTVEIVAAVARQGEANLAAAGYRNVTVRIGDGYAGWPERAPFDAIVVTAAAPYVPQPLIDQLRPGGRMVIPVRAGLGGEELLLVRKDADGRVSRERVLPVRFVPLTRKLR